MLPDEVKIIRKEIFDPAWQKYVMEELPTTPVHGAKRLTGVARPGTALLRRTLSGGTVLSITMLRIAASAEHEFYIRDRGGTIDYPYLEAAGAETLLGAVAAPVHVVKGSFVIGIQGSYASGTHIAVYEGFERFSGTQTIA